jgi:hypothetical protein
MGVRYIIYKYYYNLRVIIVLYKINQIILKVKMVLYKNNTYYINVYLKSEL